MKKKGGATEGNIWVPCHKNAPFPFPEQPQSIDSTEKNMFAEVPLILLVFCFFRFIQDSFCSPLSCFCVSFDGIPNPPFHTSLSVSHFECFSCEWEEFGFDWVEKGFFFKGGFLLIM